jgi:hypothetical protein
VSCFSLPTFLSSFPLTVFYSCRLAGPYPELFTSGKLKSNPLLRREGGLEKIDEGLEFLKAGKVCSLLSLCFVDVLTMHSTSAELGSEVGVLALSKRRTSFRPIEMQGILEVTVAPERTM